MEKKIKQKEVLESMLKEQEKYHANPNCPICEGTGTKHIPDGPDDVISEMCDCVIIEEI